MINKFIKIIVRCYKLALPFGSARLTGISILILLSGLLQVIGVTSILPFFALASNPSAFRQSDIGGAILAALPSMDDRQLLVASGILAIVFLIVANLITLVSEVVRANYAYKFGAWMRCKLASEMASQPYSYFLKNNTAALLQKMLNDVSAFITNVFLPLTEVISRLITMIFLVATVFLVDSVIAVAAASGFIIFYSIVILVIRPRSIAIGRGLKEHNRGMIVAAQQLMAGIKPIMALDKKDHFVDKFRYHAESIAPFYAKLPLYNHTPRYLVEPLAFGGLVATIVVLAAQGKSFTDVLPTLAVIALAGYRMLPTVQTLYSQLSVAMSHSYLLKEIEDEIRETSSEKRALTNQQTTGESAQLEFKNEIVLDDVNFRYENTTKPILEGINLRIRHGDSVGIMGSTGSGKSTLVDLILGLHQPSAGKIVVDGIVLEEKLMPGWRKNIGYVPQDIFLIDNTIAANIAFGVPEADIDEEKLKQATQAAQIYDFIMQELPEKFMSKVGERGVRLSGGQRQRIGLARALYNWPEVLILDEATSALDNETEAAVMDTIHSLQGKLTIVAIAHRLSTLNFCNVRAKMDAGKISVERVDTPPEPSLRQ